MILRKVKTDYQLQNLVTHIILTQKEHYTVSQITDKVLKSEFFNNFCNRNKVEEMVSETITAFLRHNFVNTYDFGYRNYVTIT